MAREPIARALVAFVLVAANAMGQDLPPHPDLLSRVKAHMADRLARLPDYSCLETFHRFHRPAGVRGKMSALDTIRLEILYSDHRDLYGSPGERRFHSEEPWKFVGSGMIGAGLFTLQLKSVLLNSSSMLTYHGEEQLHGTAAVRYDFHLRARDSGYGIQVVGGNAAVGISGSVWADPLTLDVLRLTTVADEIPPFLQVQRATTLVNYTTISIGGSTQLLPQDAELYLLESSGEENRDFVQFTHCRAFHTETTIRFDAQESARTNADTVPASMPEVERQVPALLAVTVQLKSRINEQLAVGTMIEGLVTADVRKKGTVVIPSGSIVHGRIRRLERSERPAGYFIVGLEFIEIEVLGERMRFFADLLKINRVPGVQISLSRPLFVGRVASIQKITLPELPGVASFFVRGKDLLIPSGLQMTWRTRSVLRGE